MACKFKYYLNNLAAMHQGQLLGSLLQCMTDSSILGTKLQVRAKNFRISVRTLVVC